MTSAGSKKTRTAWLSPIVLWLIMLLTCSCDTGRLKQESNLICLCIDGLHYTDLGCYGSRNPAAPCFDRLADSGFVFERAFSQSPDLHDSHKSMATSLYPSEPGPPDRSPEAGRGVEFTLAEILRFHGFRTAAFTGGNPLVEDKGFDRGFDRFEENRANYYTSIYDSIKNAETWLAQYGRENSRFFLFIQGRLNRTRAVESGIEVFSADEEQLRKLEYRIAGLLKMLSERDILNSTYIFMYAGRSYPFAEDPESEYSTWNRLGDRYLRVPFIVHAPLLGKRFTISEVVEMIDLLPTALELLSLQPTKRTHGFPLVTRSWRGLSPAGSGDSPTAGFAASRSGNGGLSVRSGTSRITGNVTSPHVEVPEPIPVDRNILYEKIDLSGSSCEANQTEEQADSLWNLLQNWKIRLDTFPERADSPFERPLTKEEKEWTIQKGYF